jgi:hypothetical protein
MNGCPHCGHRYPTVRVLAHCRRRYRRACACPVSATVTAPGPPKAIGKGSPDSADLRAWAQPPPPG